MSTSTLASINFEKLSTAIRMAASFSLVFGKYKRSTCTTKKGLRGFVIGLWKGGSKYSGFWA